MFGLSGAFTLLLKAAGVIYTLNSSVIGRLVLVCSWVQICLGILVICPSLSAITPHLEKSPPLLWVSWLTFRLRICLPMATNFAEVLGLPFANPTGSHAEPSTLAGVHVNLVTIRSAGLVAGDAFFDPNLADAQSMIRFVTLILPIVVGQVWFRHPS